MADLLRNNNCIGCGYYESEANDYYFEWCKHPEADDNLEKDNSPYSDFSEFVAKCPLTGESPYL